MNVGQSGVPVGERGSPDVARFNVRHESGGIHMGELIVAAEGVGWRHSHATQVTWMAWDDLGAVMDTHGKESP